MASVNPYSPCPCGSGQKSKWCCHKVESYAERTQRMVENGQSEAAIKPLAQGLAKYPDSPWLLTREDLIEVHLDESMRRRRPAFLLKKEPGHLGATILMTRLLMERQGATAAIAQFQQGLSAMAPERRGELSLGLAVGQLAGADPASRSPGSSTWSWSRNRTGRRTFGVRGDRLVEGPRRALGLGQDPCRLWPAPEGIGDRFRESLENGARDAAKEGYRRPPRRRSTVAAGRPRRDRRSQPGDLLPLDRRHRRAHRSLRRLIARTGPSVEAVNLEAIVRGSAAPDRRSRRVRPPELADPEPGGAPGRPASRRVVRAGADRPSIRRPRLRRDERFYMLDRKKIEAKPGLTPRTCRSSRAR